MPNGGGNSPGFPPDCSAAGIGGAIGGLLGNLATWATDSSLGQVVGWMLMGLAIGVAGGIAENPAENAATAPSAGPWADCWADCSSTTIASGSSMAARATAFVILGTAIGALVGLAQLVLKEAWLTVVDGFRPGRELILGQTVTLLGRGDHLPLPLLGYPGRDLEAEHARIIRQPDGQFVLEDNRSRLGTRLNGQPVEAAMPLKDGDLIKLGTNIIRFNSRQWGSAAGGGRDGRAVGGPVPRAASDLRRCRHRRCRHRRRHRRRCRRHRRCRSVIPPAIRRLAAIAARAAHGPVAAADVVRAVRRRRCCLAGRCRHRRRVHDRRAEIPLRPRRRHRRRRPRAASQRVERGREPHA